MSTSSLIDATALTRRFGDLTAVDAVSFTLRRGEVVGFLGPNGAGKSTTMQMLAGALTPTAGGITVAGIDLLEQPAKAKRQIGYLPEQPPLYRDQSVDELLAFCAELRGVHRRHRAARIAAVKAQTGLDEVGKRLIGHLSKGFQQRVGIAQALVHDPSVVILDEPTSGLDPNQLREVRALIRELGRERGVILSTHILPEVQSVCDRVLLLRRGQIVFDDSLVTAGTGSSGELVARVAEPVTDTVRAALESAVGVLSVRLDGPLELTVSHDGRAETIDAVVCSLSGLGLRQLETEQRSLEDLFVSLTLGREH
ncbi:MAG: ATP-binding cassette domain-containing protein [Pseudomonadota bacterium]